MQTLQITPRAEKRLKSGHLWIYSNEIDNQKTPLKSVEAGEQVVVCNADGKTIAHALMNPSQLICGKIVSRKKPFSKKVLEKRIEQALALRESCYPEPYYRLVYAEGDYLPGLVIDRYGSICVVQLNSIGMEGYQQEIAEVLEKVVGATGVLFRNDGASRTQEGIEEAEDVIFGEVPEFAHLVENDTEFMAPIKDGQKTGWFYDHRRNRRELSRLVAGKRVLDVFSYVGAWGIQALQAGAESLTAIDASEFALDCLEQNAAMNGFENTVMALQGNAFDAMKALLEQGEKYDVVVLDPPAFIKKKKDFNRGLQAYKKCNELALRLVDKGGLLVSASCSYAFAGCRSSRDCAKNSSSCRS